MSSQKVALITGGGSGIGLATAKYLAGKGWQVSIAELDQNRGEEAAKEVGGIFTKADVTRYEDQAKVFSNTWEKYGRIDFVFANAGILDVVDFYRKQEDLPPPKPSLITSEVDLNGVIYSVYLAMHYFRRNPTPGGSIIATSSAAGIYATPVLPIYAAAKHGVIGLVRSLGPQFQNENIRISAILPGAVPTNIGVPPVVAASGVNPTLDESAITTTQHIIDAVVDILEDPNAFGRTVEVSTSNRYDRKQPEYADATMRLLKTGLWKE